MAVQVGKKSLRNDHSFDLTITLLGTYPKKRTRKVHKNACVRIFTMLTSKNIPGFH